jgi:hypothetical protein
MSDRTLITTGFYVRSRCDSEDSAWSRKRVPSLCRLRSAHFIPSNEGRGTVKWSFLPSSCVCGRTFALPKYLCEIHLLVVQVTLPCTSGEIKVVWNFRNLSLANWPHTLCPRRTQFRVLLLVEAQKRLFNYAFCFTNWTSCGESFTYV